MRIVNIVVGVVLLVGALLFLLAIFDPVIIIPTAGVEWGLWLSILAIGLLMVFGLDREKMRENLATRSPFMRWLGIIVGFPLLTVVIGSGLWFGWHYAAVQFAERGSVEMSLARFERSGRSQGIELAEPMLFFDRIPYLPDDRRWDEMVGNRVCLEGRRSARAIDVASLRLTERKGEGVTDCQPPFDGPVLDFSPLR